MNDESPTQALETRLVNAWPSLEVQACGGWLLRFARGYSKRANAATPLVPGAALDEALVEHIGRQYAAQKIRTVFRLTGLEAPGAGWLLAGLGFEEVEPSYGMTMAVTDIPEIADGVGLEARPTARWVREAAASYGGDKADDAILLEIVSRIRQRAAFATLHLDDRPAAWGFGVVERGYLGLYDIVVAPDLRGVGLGRRLTCALLAWGRTEGAHTAYLQVREENPAARALYASLGFRDAYRYTHRIRP